MRALRADRGPTVCPVGARSVHDRLGFGRAMKREREEGVVASLRSPNVSRETSVPFFLKCYNIDNIFPKPPAGCFAIC